MVDIENEKIVCKEKNGRRVLQFKKLLAYDNIIHHGYSLGITVNYRTATPDLQEIPKNEYEKAMQDYRNLAEQIGSKVEHLVKTNQYHTDVVKNIQEKINPNMPDVNSKQYMPTDGLITKQKNRLLATTNADCILLLFFDPVTKTIANVHSGWKGTLQKIGSKTVRKMKQEMGCRPENIICCICPSIRKCHFEVDKEVKDQFQNKFKELKEIDQIIEKQSDAEKWNIDTVLVNQILLKQEGLKPENIIDSGICSVCHKDIIHSYRAEKQGYGLETAIIELI